MKSTPHTPPAYQTQNQLILLDRHAPVVAGIHPLGGGKLAVEAHDFVGGLKSVTVAGAPQLSKSWTTSFHHKYSMKVHIAAYIVEGRA